MRFVGGIAGEFQGEIGLDGRADVAGPAFVQGPAAVRVLLAAQVDGDLAFTFTVDRAHEVLQEQIFGRDRCVRFELEQPVPVVRLMASQRLRGAIHRRLHRIARNFERVYRLLDEYFGVDDIVRNLLVQRISDRVFEFSHACSLCHPPC